MLPFVRHALNVPSTWATTLLSTESLTSILAHAAGRGSPGLGHSREEPHRQPRAGGPECSAVSQIAGLCCVPVRLFTEKFAVGTCTHAVGKMAGTLHTCCCGWGV